MYRDTLSEALFRPWARACWFTGGAILVATLLGAVCPAKDCDAAQQAPAADSARELAGRVIDERGQPVAGAKVVAMGYPEASEKIQELASTVAAANGSFRFAAEKLPRVVGIVAWKEDRGLDWADWTEPGSAEPVLQLGPPAAIDGEIVDEAGQPVVGAAVALLLTTKEPGSKKMPVAFALEPFLAKTDAQGRFRFTSLPELATVAFDITATGRARALAEGSFTAGQKGLRLVLPPEGRLDGIVVEKGTERSLAGVTVRATGSVTSGLHQASAKTDKDGHFSLAGLSGGHYEIAIVGDGQALPEWLGSQEKLQVENGKVAATKIEAVRGGVLEIVAVDAAGGKPVAVSAVVQVSPAEDLRIASSALMARDGVAKLYLLPGKYVIPSMWVTGYSYKEEKGHSFLVEAGKTERAVVSVTAVPQIVIAVSDTFGKPVPAAIGQVLPLRGPPRGVVADANGRLVLFAADMGPLFCFVLVRHPQQNLTALAAVAKDEKPPTVRLRAPTKVSGTVKDTNGLPVGNALVQAQIDASHMGRFAVVAKAQTDKNGRYQLELADTVCQYAVSVHAPGCSVAEVMLDQPQIARGQALVRDLVLKAAHRKVRGIVKDAAGNPVPGAIITASATSAQNFPGSAITDSSGRFVLENLGDESVIYVFAHVPGRGWIGDSTIKPGDQELTITAAPSHWD